MDSRKFFLRMQITGMATLFFIASILPIIGPIFLAYMLGISQPRSEKIYGIKLINYYYAMVIGEFIFFIISFLITIFIIEFYKPITFYYVTFIAFGLNYIFSFIALSLGVNKAKKNK